MDSQIQEEKEQVKEDVKVSVRKTSRKISMFMTLEEHVAKHNIKYYSIMGIIGLINNLGYVLVGSASQEISDKFEKNELMGLFQLALIIFSSVVRFINMRFLIHILHRYRIFCIVIISIAGYVTIAIACAAKDSWGFYVSLVGSVLCGSMQAFGEGVNLGFLKSFPSTLVGGWSMGTGLAGIVGTLLFIFLEAVKVPLSYIFAFLIPIEFIFLAGFIWYDKKKAKFQKNMLNTQKDSTLDDTSSSQGRKKSLNFNISQVKDNKVVSSDENITDPLIRNQQSVLKEEEEYYSHLTDIDNQSEMDQQRSSGEDVALPEADKDASGNVEFNFQSFRRVFPKLWFNAVCICLVYFFEYCCITGFANHITERMQRKSDHPDSFWVKQSYVILNFCYQFGVFASRSSLSIIKVKQIWLLTALQLVNWIAYFFFAWYDFMPLEGLIPVMLWVGFMGGATYVNVMYLIINSDNIPQKEKELSVNIVSIFNDTGVLTASLFSILLEKKILNNRW